MRRACQLSRFGITGDGEWQGPQQFAVILLFDQSDDLSLFHRRQVISDRVLAVPRLRQRLIKVPAGLRAFGVGGRG